MTVALIRTIILYIVVIIAVRLMGKRQISELQTSELVITMLISDIAAIPMQNTSQPLVSGLLPILILIACEIIISVIMLKSAGFRRFICGKPVIVINDGKIDQFQMKRLRMSTEDLFEQLRQMDIFKFDDVAYAIVETNGKMSVLKKGSKQEPNVEMMQLKPEEDLLETVVISDGELSRFSLALCDLNEQQIKKVLLNKNIKQEEVFIMTADKKQNYKIVKKEK